MENNDDEKRFEVGVDGERHTNQETVQQNAEFEHEDPNDLCHPTIRHYRQPMVVVPVSMRMALLDVKGLALSR